MALAILLGPHRRGPFPFKALVDGTRFFLFFFFYVAFFYIRFILPMLNPVKFTAQKLILAKDPRFEDPF